MQAFVCVCPRLLTFARVCLRLRLCVCLRLSAFACLLAFACAPLCCAALCVTLTMLKVFMAHFRLCNFILNAHGIRTYSKHWPEARESELLRPSALLYVSQSTTPWPLLPKEAFRIKTTMALDFVMFAAAVVFDYLYRFPALFL